MNRFIISVFLISSLASCKKSKEDANQNVMPAQLKDHTWILDSVYNLYPDRGDTGYLSPEFARYDTFTDSVRTYHGFNSSIVLYSIYFESPDRIYWASYGNVPKHVNPITIELLTDKNLSLKFYFNNTEGTYPYTMQNFYHAE